MALGPRRRCCSLRLRLRLAALGSAASPGPGRDAAAAKSALRHHGHRPLTYVGEHCCSCCRARRLPHPRPRAASINPTEAYVPNEKPAATSSSDSEHNQSPHRCSSYPPLANRCSLLVPPAPISHRFDLTSAERPISRLHACERLALSVGFAARQPSPDRNHPEIRLSLADARADFDQHRGESSRQTSETLRAPG